MVDQTPGSVPDIALTPPDPRPFVKWAGGKTALLGAIAERIPAGTSFRRYYEPFVGAGAMFFWIRRSYPHIQCAVSDQNTELIAAYRAIQTSVESVLSKLETHALLHSEEHYYAVRASRPHDDVESAARFIYLNRTCYNGLYRVNRKGEFNVPMGRYANPKILDRENLLAVAQALQSVSLSTDDFEVVTQGCGSGDLIYLDPPYDPLSPTSQFTSYTAGGFGMEEQKRLASTFETLCQRGASVVLSNSDTPFVRQLYQKLIPTPVIDEVRASRSINSKGGSRGPVGELLIHYRADPAELSSE